MQVIFLESFYNDHMKDALQVKDLLAVQVFRNDINFVYLFYAHQWFSKFNDWSYSINSIQFMAAHKNCIVIYKLNYIN